MAFHYFQFLIIIIIKSLKKLIGENGRKIINRVVIVRYASFINTSTN